MKGVGQGVLSGVTKPICAVSQAVTDIGTGAAASVGGIVVKHRIVVDGRRTPRLQGRWGGHR